MITFEPDSPWEVGQIVMFRDEKAGVAVAKIVTSVEHAASSDTSETQYTFENYSENSDASLIYAELPE